MASGFVLAGRNGVVVLQLAEEILDEVADLVGVFVEIALKLAVALGRDHEGLSPCKQRLSSTSLAGPA